MNTDLARNHRPRSAVIGAGISGLTVGKMLKDYGVPCTTFETSDGADQRRYPGHCTYGARRTQQVDHFYDEHYLRTREVPAGRKRAAARPDTARLAPA